MVIWVVEFASEGYILVNSHVNAQKTRISFKDIDFWPKIYLILYHSFENSTTHITIMLHTPNQTTQPSQSPNFFIEYLTQNVIFHVKSHVTKHEFRGLLVLK